jgi:hypothetical protein
MEGLQDVEQIDYKLGAQVLKLRWEVSSSDVWGMCRGCNACLGFVDTDVGGAAEVSRCQRAALGVVAATFSVRRSFVTQLILQQAGNSHSRVVAAAITGGGAKHRRH